MLADFSTSIFQVLCPVPPIAVAGRVLGDPHQLEQVCGEHLLYAGPHARGTKGGEKLVSVFFNFTTHCRDNSPSKGRDRALGTHVPSTWDTVWH